MNRVATNHRLPIQPISLVQNFLGGLRPTIHSGRRPKRGSPSHKVSRCRKASHQPVFHPQARHAPKVIEIGREQQRVIRQSHGSDAQVHRSNPDSLAMQIFKKGRRHNIESNDLPVAKELEQPSQTVVCLDLPTSFPRLVNHIQPTARRSASRIFRASASISFMRSSPANIPSVRRQSFGREVPRRSCSTLLSNSLTRASNEISPDMNESYSPQIRVSTWKEPPTGRSVFRTESLTNRPGSVH